MKAAHSISLCQSAEIVQEKREKKSQMKKYLSLKIKPMWQVFHEEEESKQLAGSLMRPKKSSVSTMDDLKSYKDKVTHLTFDDFFETQHKLGQGCHSSVYACIEKQTGKKYAVKILKKPDLELVLSIRENYRIMNKMKNESIAKAKLLYIDQKISTFYVVQELCPGVDLGHYIASKKGQVDELQSCKIIQQILKAVEYMHEMGICHRDLKPENIMYDPIRKKIKIVDFQTSRMVKYTKEKFQLWTKTGALPFRAPQTFKATYDEKVDIWSVGVIAYLLITGRMPFRNQYESDLIKAIMNDDPNFGEMAWWQKDLLKKMLEKKSELRPSAAEALSSAYFLMNFEKADQKAPVAKSPMVKSPSLGQEKFQSFGEAESNSKFFDDDRACDFLGGNDDTQVFVNHKY